MSRFEEFFLASNQLRAVGGEESQLRLHEWLARVANGSQLRFVEKPIQSPLIGERVRIGVALWSGYDMALLDTLDQALSDGELGGGSVVVFDFGREWTPQQDRTLFLPTLHFSKVFNPPVIGWWRGGALEAAESGRAAVERLLRAHNLEDDWRERMARLQASGRHADRSGPS